MIAEFDQQVDELLGVDEANINTHYAKIASELGYWGRMYASVYREWRLAKLQKQRLEAALKQGKRAELEMARGKVTIDQVEAAVVADPQMQECENAEVEAEFEKLNVGAVVDALSAKKEMLISLGAHMRAEMGGDPSIRQTAV